MSRYLLLGWILLLLVPHTLLSQSGSASQNIVDEDTVNRQVNVSVDDLPMARFQDLEELEARTERLLQQFRNADIPVSGFVNEGRVDVGGQRERRIATLERWLEEGHILGNHTYSHASLYDTPVDLFITEEVIRGEQFTNELLKKHGQQDRYFRHPYLHPGPDNPTKLAFEAFLDSWNYEIAPVTVENTDWLFNLAYRQAGESADSTTLRRFVVDEYVAHTERMFEYYEAFSRELLNRELPQIFLIHANRLNARYFHRLVEMMERRGYEFIQLDEALEDEAYDLPDDYYNPEPTSSYVSWLERWRYTEGLNNHLESLPDWPTVSEDIREIAYPEDDNDDVQLENEEEQ